MARWIIFMLVPVIAGCKLKTEITDLDAKAPDFSLSSITVTNPGIADGTTPVTITIIVKDHGTPLVGFLPSYTVSGTGNTLGACSLTDASGISTCLLRSTNDETKTITLVNPNTQQFILVTFNPAVPAVPGFAITSGGGLTSGAGILSQSSIGIPTSPMILRDPATPTLVRARTGIQGVLAEGN